MTFNATILTLYPEMFPGPLGMSLAGRALREERWSCDPVQIRDFAIDKHRTVDDTPAGGGAGMVLRVDVVAAALDSVADDRPRIALTPRGTPLTQARVRALAAGPGVTLLCGRFEGFDERVFAARDVEEVSIGDYILSGGEMGALVLLDACIRLLPGVMGAPSSGDGRELRDGAARIPALYPTSDMGRAHDPRSAAIGGSCEDRGLATSQRGDRYTAKAAGPLGAPRGRSGRVALWCAARRRETEMNLIQTLEAEQIAKFHENKQIPEFRPGDTVKVGVKVVEGERTRVQNYEGVCIARANRGMGSSFTVRKMSFGEGVERVFPLYSPNIDSIEVVRKGAVRRAKLYYLRGRTGKAARIAERRDPRPPKGSAA